MSPHSPEGQRDAGHWRRLEAEARLIALTMSDPERKRVMLFIAEGYKLLAERAELRDTLGK
jgi:plasmid stability protein